MKSQTDAAIEAFLAKKGATRIPEGRASLNLSGKEWSAKIRGEESPRKLRQEQESQRIRVVIDHAGREFLQNEAGEWL